MVVNVITSFLQTGDKTMLKHFKNFLTDQNGAAVVEYAVIAAVIGIGIIAASNVLKDGVNSSFSNIVSTLSAESKDNK